MLNENKVAALSHPAVESGRGAAAAGSAALRSFQTLFGSSEHSRFRHFSSMEKTASVFSYIIYRSVGF